MAPKKLSSISYRKDMLETAVQAVISGTFTAKQSAGIYGVPVAAVSGALRKKGLANRKKKEQADYLPQVDAQLVDWLQLMSDIGCYSLRNQMKDIISEAYERCGHKIKFLNEMEQSSWIGSFSERQTSIPKSSIEPTSSATGITSEYIDQWLDKLKDRLHSCYNIDINQFAKETNAGNIFCCFELGSVYFFSGRQDYRFFYRPTHGNVEGKFIMSLYACLCADGGFLKPVCIVKDETLSQTVMETGTRDFHILSSREGKMNCDSTMLWMQLIDVEIEQKKNDMKPFLLFLDLSIRPISLATLDFCRQRNLIVFYLPGHYPAVRLPFGMDIFYNLNGEYEKVEASDEAKETKSVEGALNNLMNAWKLMLGADSNITEFCDFGLVPLNVSSMKSTVEEIVPLILSPPEEVVESQASHVLASTDPDSRAVGSETVLNATIQQPSVCSTGSGNKIVKVSENEQQSEVPCSTTEITPNMNSEDGSDEDNCIETDPNTSMKVRVPNSKINANTDKKSKLKVKIRRSDRISSSFKLDREETFTDESMLSRNISKDCEHNCSDCELARTHGLRSGVIQGLVFALKRIESTIRADTLDLYRSRYLSPYISDHRPSEPSFVMWCELMKCLEMGPDAVQKDFLIARSIQMKNPNVEMVLKSGKPFESSRGTENERNFNVEQEEINSRKRPRSPVKCGQNASENISNNYLCISSPSICRSSQQTHSNRNVFNTETSSETAYRGHFKYNNISSAPCSAPHVNTANSELNSRDECHFKHPASVQLHRPPINDIPSQSGTSRFAAPIQRSHLQRFQNASTQPMWQNPSTNSVLSSEIDRLSVARPYSNTMATQHSRERFQSQADASQTHWNGSVPQRRSVNNDFNDQAPYFQHPQSTNRPPKFEFKSLQRVCSPAGGAHFSDERDHCDSKNILPRCGQNIDFSDGAGKFAVAPQSLKNAPHITSTPKASDVSGNVMLSTHEHQSRCPTIASSSATINPIRPVRHETLDCFTPLCEKIGLDNRTSLNTQPAHSVELSKNLIEKSSNMEHNQVVNAPVKLDDTLQGSYPYMQNSDSSHFENSQQHIDNFSHRASIPYHYHPRYRPEYATMHDAVLPQMKTTANQQMIVPRMGSPAGITAAQRQTSSSPVGYNAMNTRPPLQCQDETKEYRDRGDLSYGYVEDHHASHSMQSSSCPPYLPPQSSYCASTGYYQPAESTRPYDGVTNASRDETLREM